MNNLTIVHCARYVLWFVVITTILLIAFLWSSVAYSATNEFSLSEEDGTVFITCRSDSCELKSVSVDRNARTGWRNVVLGPGVEDFNFGKRTEAQTIGEHVRSFNIDLSTGEIVRLQCTVPAIHLLVESERATKCVETQNSIRMRFGFRIGIYAPKAIEVDINGGQSVFTHAR